MKKNLIWTLAALFVGGLALTSCDVSDNPNPNPVLPSDPEELWEKTSNVFDFEDGTTTLFVGGKTPRMSLEIQDNAAKGSKVLAFKNAGNAQNGYGFMAYNFTSLVNKATKVQVNFDYYNTNGGRGSMTIGDALVRGADGAGAGFGRGSYGAKGAIVRVGSDGSNFFVNSRVLGSKDDWCNKWLTVEIGVYNFDRQIEWVIKDMDGEILAQSGVTEGEGDEAVFTPGKEDFWQADANEATQIDCFGWINNSVNYIDNLSITNAQDPSIKFWDYKIRYVDADGKDLKEARVANGREGTDPTILASDSASFYLNEAGEVVTNVADAAVKKIYVSNNAADVKVAENAEVLLTFRDAETHYAVLACNTEGGVLLERFNDVDKYKFFEGDEFILYVPNGYGKDGAYYFAEKSTCSDNKIYNSVFYKFPGSLNPTVAGGKTYYIGSLSYAKVDSVAYYANFETLALPKEDAGNGTGLGQLEGTVTNWWNWTNGYWERIDGGRGITLGANSYVWTEPIAEAGNYKVTIYGRNNIYYNQSGYAIPQPYKLGLRDAEGKVTYLDVAIPDWASSATGTHVVESVAIPAGSSLVIMYDGSTVTADDGTELVKDITFDDISLTKVAE
ncbi:MAG: hypothetical protein IJ804_10785 [Prevotella sp.]|nr:hypothetical protein [Prevotella sp.]